MDSPLQAGPIALLAGLLAALVLAGCGGSTAATIDPVAQAADATSHTGGAQMSLNITMELGGLASPITLDGTGNFNFANREGEIVSNLTGLPASALAALHGSSLHITELYAKNSLYLESPAFAGKLPAGARWMKLDLTKLASGIGLNPEALSSGQSNPAQFLEYLKDAGGSAKKIGTEAIRGTQTTRYRVTVDLAKELRNAPAASRALLGKAIEQLSSSGGASFPVEAWVDSHNLLRRMKMTLASSLAGQRVGIAITLEMFNFGSTPAVNVPPAGEVFEATQSSLGALGAAG